MPQHTSTWIVVADIDRARILYLERPGAPVRRVFEESAAPLRRFAVADVVNEMVANHEFDRLVLVAAPRTLGELRETLSAEARGYIAAECEQDLSRFSDDMVVHVLREVGLGACSGAEVEDDDASNDCQGSMQ